MFTHRLEAIRDRIRVTDFDRPLTVVENKIVDGGFVDARHLIAISVAARSGHFAVTFRDAGIDTIEWLKKGAATKPHGILEKTLKPSRLRDSRIIDGVERYGLKGLTAHWDAHGAPIGIFITETAARKLKSTPQIVVKQDAHGNYWLPVDFVHQHDRNLSLFKEISDWQRMVIAGDYDLHDMISFEGMPHTPPSGSNEEKFIRLAINAAVGSIEHGRESREHRVVQHGPQVSYPAFVGTNEKEKFHSLVKAVAEPSLVSKKMREKESPSLALCDRGDWSMLLSLEDLSAFYQKHHAVMKTTWQPGADHLHYEATEAGHVKLSPSKR